ncbi:MAG TPA: sugar transferase [Terriglobales bacterium]|nr:sugar transferase [Terriglobales bacterium]
MGQLATILGFRSQIRTPASPGLPLPVSNFARLIPGRSTDPEPYGEVLEKFPTSTLAPDSYRQVLRKFLAELVPKLIDRVHAAMFVPAAIDVALIALAFSLEKFFLGDQETVALSSSLLFIYVIAFLVFAMEEGLYPAGEPTPSAEIAAAVRTVACATLFALLSSSFSLPRITVVSLLAFSGLSLLGMLALRRVRRMLTPLTDKGTRNVLIVGSGQKAQRIAEVLRRQQSSLRSIKGFMAENHLRNVYGPSMLRRIAREEFVDELIIASADPAIVRIAVQEGRRNSLDIRIVPELGVASLTGEIVFENLAGIPLLKIEDHQLPEYELAAKRCFDIIGSFIGLIVLAPLLLLIGAVVRLGSRGAALYRAPRTGRKGRQFTCYKFRTMVEGADAIKGELRSKNERDGAFFKIANDPRITRIGKFLRRYSLDELPQLWNVLLGDMSLVGPRPHPPDDVSLYQTHHLQRLDFVPGITGLWQIKARQDRSFERCVALDVEYIRRWNLWLDATILWRTIFVVLEGSGA